MREIATIYSNQEETDTRVALNLHHAAAFGYKNAVVRTPDADIFMILLYQAHAIKLTVYLDTGSGKHRQLINLSDLAVSLGENYCATLLGIYVFSGEDCTSAFKEKGKMGPLKKLDKNPRFHNAFMKDEHGWIRTEDGLLEPAWHCGPVLPNSLIDLLDTGDSEEVDEEEEEAEEEFDFDDDFSGFRMTF